MKLMLLILSAIFGAPNSFSDTSTKVAYCKGRGTATLVCISSGDGPGSRMEPFQTHFDVFEFLTLQSNKKPSHFVQGGYTFSPRNQYEGELCWTSGGIMTYAQGSATSEKGVALDFVDPAQPGVDGGSLKTFKSLNAGYAGEIEFKFPWIDPGFGGPVVCSFAL